VSLSLQLTSSYASHTVYLCCSATLIIHNSLILSLPAYNLPVSQILPTVDSLIPPAQHWLHIITRTVPCKLYRSLVLYLIFLFFWFRVEHYAGSSAHIKHFLSYHMHQRWHKNILQQCTSWYVHWLRQRSVFQHRWRHSNTFIQRTLHAPYCWLGHRKDMQPSVLSFVNEQNEALVDAVSEWTMDSGFHLLSRLEGLDKQAQPAGSGAKPRPKAKF